MRQIAVGLVALALLTGCSSKPDPAACEARMRQAYSEGSTLASRPPECNGIDEATLGKIVGKILESETPPGL